MSDTQMLSKHLPKKLYNAAADEDGTDLTAKEALPEDRLTALETYVGDYSSQAKGEGSDIATDLATVYASVETAETGLNARIDDLENTVGTYAGVNDISTDLATVYAQYHLDKYDGTDAPGATDDSTELYSVGSKWYDATHTEWYICTSAVENAATWELTTLDTGDLGSAAVADIVNDLTTGGIADALSAEQGKELKSTLNSEAGYIDALQAVAPEYVDTFATAMAATATYTIGETNPAVGSTVVVNDQTYRFMDTMTTANDVQIGEDADTTLGNLVAAINLSGTAGTEYYDGTSAATGVTAGAVGSHATKVTADTAGTAANAYTKGVSADPDPHIVLDDTDPADKFSGGVDGQVGATGKIIFTDTGVYCCTDGDKCTIADSSGWKNADLAWRK